MCNFFILVTLLESSIALAQTSETIPFDYFFGRIIGGQHPSIEFFDATRQTAVFSVSHQLGQHDKFSASANDFVKLWTKHFLDPLGIEPSFRSAIQLSRPLRLNITNLMYRETSGSRATPLGEQIQSSDELDLKLGVNYLSSAGIRYQPERSTALYIDGLALGPGETTVMSTADVYRENSIRQQFDPQTGRQRRSSSTHQSFSTTNLTTSAQRGFSKKLTLGFYCRYRSETTSAETQYYYRDLDSDSTNTDNITGYIDSYRFDFSLTGSVHFSERTWLNTRLQYHHFTLESEELRAETVSHWVNRLESYGSLADWQFTHLSRNVPISLDRVLDNYCGYYHEQLAGGLWMFRLSGKWNVYVTDRGSFAGSFRQTGQNLKYHSIQSSASIRYYISAGAYVEPKLSYSSVSDSIITNNFDPIQFQSLRPELSVSYQSFVWDPAKRSEISWNGVSDLDYLLSPLLRPGDWETQITLAPPYKKSLKVEEPGWLPRSAHFEWDHEWAVALSARLGLISGIEAGLSVEWRQLNGDGEIHPRSSDGWGLGVSGAWQLKNRFRVAGTLHNQYPRSYFTDYVYERSWRVDARLDFLL